MARTADLSIGAVTNTWPPALADAVIPAMLSAPARDLLRRGIPSPEAGASSLAEQRDICARIQTEFSARQLERYPVTITDDVIGGVPVRVFRPENASQRSEAVLLNCHGGGFTKDSGSLTENVPIAYLTGTTVVAVLYRLAPENRFPSAVIDAEIVYRDLLNRHSPTRIGLYGTSAGAILSAQMLVRIQQAGDVPMPARLGFFSGSADPGTAGDSEYFFPLSDDPRPVGALIESYIGADNLDNPAISPIFADLSAFPPTLCITATRDLMHSQTSIFHRALLRAGVDARLIVFEAMPHAHWSYLELPESDEAFEYMSNFLRQV